MKYKIVLILLIVFFLGGCRNIDSVKFKEEFESFNNLNDYVNVSISSNNPFVYISDSNLIKKIESKEDMVVLFGYSKSNDTRSILNTLLKTNLDKIYYLDISSIRDEIAVDNNQVVIKNEGSTSYHKIMELLSEHLDDYVVNGMVVGKRIYAPTVLIIRNGNIDLLTKIDDIKKISDYNFNSCSDNGC